MAAAMLPPPATTAPTRPGRPRSERARRAILDAALELMLEHGPGATSMESIARRAGASKATIYRWWPSKELLAVEALLAEWDQDGEPEPDTGSLAGDLRALLLPWVARLQTRPYARVIAGLLAQAQSDEKLARQYRASFVEHRRERARAALTRAMERGEVALDVDVEAALDMLYGPIYHRLLQGHVPLQETFAEQVLAGVMAVVA